MSDERFDHDLRSVLLEGAPQDVPDSLRRRVAAVPAENPVRAAGSRWSWPAGLALRTAGLVALVALLAVGFWRFGPAAQLGVGASPSSPSTAVPSAAPSTSTAAPASAPPSASAAARESASPSAPASAAASAGDACTSADLTGRILGWQGAAGSRIADVEITNHATRRCAIRGTPALELIDAHGRVLIDSRTAGPSGEPHVAPNDPSFELAPGGRLGTEVAVSNYCGAAPTLPIDIAFIPPAGGGRLVARPAAGVSSAEATPPCLGSSGAGISMNGWRR